MKSTDIICLIDKSGSMHDVCSDAIGGFNAFLQSQQALGPDALLTLVLFDSRVRRMLDRVPIREATPLTADTYQPGGSTALLDAIGSVLASHTRQVADQTLVVIITDGEENASVEHSRAAIRATIGRLEKTGHWTFQFLGANIDAFAEAGKLGMALHSTADAGQMRPAAMRAMMSAASINASEYRQSGRVRDIGAVLCEQIRAAEGEGVHPGTGA